MNTPNLPEFTKLMTGLCLLYNKPANEILIELYWRALEPFEFPLVKAALLVHLNNPDTGQFMPKPADVVRYLQGSSQTQALKAWTKVAQAIRSVGGYTSVVFDDALIHAVIEDMGGWIALCQTLLKDFPFRAHEFAKRYAAYVLHPPLRHPRQLLGLEEQQNHTRGHAVRPPLLIGNAQEALRVLTLGRDKPGQVHPMPVKAAVTHNYSFSEKTQ